jgi:hypothetical protein
MIRHPLVVRDTSSSQVNVVMRVARDHRWIITPPTD